MLYCKYRPKGCIYKDIMEEVLKHEEWCYYQPATPIQYEVQQDTTLETLFQMVQDKSSRNRNSHSHLQQEIQTLKKLQNQIIETEITQQETISALTAKLQEQSRIKEEIMQKLAATQNIVKTTSQAKLHIYNKNSYNRLNNFIQESWQNFVEFERSIYDELKYALNDFHLAPSKPAAPQKRSDSVDTSKRNKNKASVSPKKPRGSAKKAGRLMI
jgi:predicted RNase H-like nuclease (RuvC/YqgF family)